MISWKEVETDDPNELMYEAAVPGGTLFRSQLGWQYDYGEYRAEQRPFVCGVGVSMVFVPTPKLAY